MKRILRPLIAVTAVVALTVSGLMAYSMMTPLVIGPGGFGGALLGPGTKASGGVLGIAGQCAQRQKDLFKWVEAYKGKHDQLPDSLETLVEDEPQCMYASHCQLGAVYVLHPENYGKSDAVLISEAENNHRNTLRLWLKGIKPEVQTMGDGTIQLFRDGKLVTIDARN